MIEEKVLASSVVLLRSCFREYYFRSTKTVEEPAKIEKREIGYTRFGQSGMVRHLSFGSIRELAAFLIKEVPSDVYCSNACYRFPTYAMQEKQWLGAEMIFDIDGKDLNLPCVPSHSYLLCVSCRASAPVQEGKKPYSCHSCGGQKAEVVSIPCGKCVEGSKNEVRKLIAFLTGDLGINQDSIRVYFSGNNGFHIYIDDPAYSLLEPFARSDIVGYLSGMGLMAESIGVRKNNTGNLSIIKFPRGGIAYGWRNRIAQKLRIDAGSVIKLRNIVDQKGGYPSFKVELDRMAKEMGVRIDPQVTTDIHRVFRMPGTLNSKSGLSKVKCTDLDSFDPFLDACLLGDNKVSVKIKTPVKFKLRHKNYNISKETAELPAFAAIYLICKGLAEAY